jgi:hypothetical protein
MRSRTSVAAAAAALLVAGFTATGGLGAAHAQPSPTPAPAPPALKTSIDADGTYKVGVDIAPGTYNSGGPANEHACYWKRVSGDNIVDNGLTKKPATVQIDPTDTAFVTSNCQPWQLGDCGDACPPAPQTGPAGFYGDLRGFLGLNQFKVPIPLG